MTVSVCLSVYLSVTSRYRKILSYRRGIARRAMSLSVEIFSTAAQLYKNFHLKAIAVNE